MRILCLLSLLFLVGCVHKCKYRSADELFLPENVWQNYEGGRFLSDKRFIQVDGLDFPNYAKFDGWSGFSVRVTPVYKKEDPMRFAYNFYYEDYIEGQEEPITRKIVNNLALGCLGGEAPPSYKFLLCLKSVEESGKSGVRLNLFRDLNKESSIFAPLPADAASPSLDVNDWHKYFYAKVNFGEPVEVFSITFSKKDDEDGMSSDVTRTFFLQMDIESDNFIDDSF